MSELVVLYEERGSVAIVTLNRPERGMGGGKKKPVAMETGFGAAGDLRALAELRALLSGNRGAEG